MTASSALIIVDVQNDFLPGGPLAVPEGDRVIPVVNALSRIFPIVVATQDWHPSYHGSFASNHPGRATGDTVDLFGLPQVVWPDHCVQGSPGADFPENLDRTRVRRVFQKGTDPRIDSYSGFFDNGRRRATGMEHFLHDIHVTDVYIVGLATDFCVFATALDAVRLGFLTHVVEDGCRGIDLKAGDSERALTELVRNGTRRTTSEQLLK